MSLVKTNIVHFKGIDKYVYLTDAQASIVVGMRNDPDKRHNFVKVGNLTFSPSDVSYIEEQSREDYSLPKYFLQRNNKEQNQIIKIN